ncbi:hypothetical protein C8A03DRAFT_13616 [Achaetomium macrosporum]|uniref:F-box domain-containing protein n=1 Tax=Achaetomium macrosporum TaxID=79813 RepID=A0AAN7H8H8_9PEZI|nr:hypothetical protein C8A03DRAFT_13616 [Achaetomium macrosporum]
MTGPRSLAEMAFRVVMANVSAITSLAGMPVEYAKKVLRAVKSAEHLRLLEVSCEGDDLYSNEWPEHWKRLIKHDFPALSAKHNFVPKDPRSWHKVYQRYKKIDEEQLAAATEKLTQDMAAKVEQENSRRATLLSASQGEKLTRKRRPRGIFATGPRPPPLRSLSVFQKTRQQVAEEARRFQLPTPTGQLKVPEGQLKKAPAAMVEDARRRSQPSFLGVPEPVSHTREYDQHWRQDKEQRLLRSKIEAKPPTTKPHPRAYVDVLEFSDDEDTRDKDDDLSDDRETEKRHPPSSRPTPPGKRPSQSPQTHLLSAAPTNKKTQKPPPPSRPPTKGPRTAVRVGPTSEESPTAAQMKTKSTSAPAPAPRGSPTSLPAPVGPPASPKRVAIPSTLEVVERRRLEPDASNLPPQFRMTLKRKRPTADIFMLQPKRARRP